MFLLWYRKLETISWQLLPMNAVGAAASMNHNYLTYSGYNPQEFGVIKVPWCTSFVMPSQKHKGSKMRQPRELHIWAHSSPTSRAKPLCHQQLSLLTCGETGAAQKEPRLCTCSTPAQVLCKRDLCQPVTGADGPGKTRTLSSTWLYFSLIHSIEPIVWNSIHRCLK